MNVVLGNGDHDAAAPMAMHFPETFHSRGHFFEEKVGRRGAFSGKAEPRRPSKYQRNHKDFVGFRGTLIFGVETVRRM